MRWRVIVGGATASILMVIVACGTTQTTTQEAPEPTAIETQQPAASPSEAAAHSAVEVGGFEWTRVTVPFHLDTVVPLGDGFLSTHFPLMTDRAEAAAMLQQVVTSPDGITWTVVDKVPLQTGDYLHLAEGGPWGAAGAVSYGDGPGPQDMMSTADGNSWRRWSTPSGLVASGEPGLVVLDGAVWFSADTEDWEPAEVGVPFSEMSDVVAGPSGFVMVTVSDISPSARSTSWAVSADGRSWESGTLGEDSSLTVAERPFMTSWREGYVIRVSVATPGTSDQSAAQLLGSTDGRSWTAMDMRAFDGLDVGVPQGSAMGLFTMGMPSDAMNWAEGVMLFSADGSNWERWSAADIFGDETVMAPRAALGSNQIVIASPAWPVEGDTEMPTTTTVWVGTPVEN